MNLGGENGLKVELQAHFWAYSVGSTVGSNISRTASTSYGWLCNSISGMLQQQQQQQQEQDEDNLSYKPAAGALAPVQWEFLAKLS
eukprot:1157817-Pelagomonas_calceolata.AAC.19